MNMIFRSVHIKLLVLGILCFVLAGPAHADDANCAVCHEQLVSGKSVHPAMAMGCASCHSALDTTDVPHKVTNRNPKGLIAKMKDLCFNCHDRGPFQKTTVHGALRLGCTTCHNPHATEHARVLKEEMPRLCLNCHAEAMTAKKGGTHTMAGNEVCSNCHQPHASDTPKLVNTQPEGASKDQTAMSKKPAAAQQ
jgi:predicted CXXCH cytochrome family protein